MTCHTDSGELKQSIQMGNSGRVKSVRWQTNTLSYVNLGNWCNGYVVTLRGRFDQEGESSNATQL